MTQQLRELLLQRPGFSGFHRRWITITSNSILLGAYQPVERQTCKEKNETGISAILEDTGSKLPDSALLVDSSYAHKCSKTLGKGFHLAVITTKL